MTNSTCKLPDCGASITRGAARGYCRPHYRAEMKHGNPSTKFGVRDCADCGCAFEPDHGSRICCTGCREGRYARTAKAYGDEHRAEAIAYNKQWRLDNPGYHGAYNKKWRANNPDAYVAAYTKYRADNLDAIRQRFADWEAANPGHTSAWAAANPERARETVRRYRAKLRAAQNFVVTESDIRRLLVRFRSSCAYCGVKLERGYHIDHVLPISLGGSNGIGNLVPSCPTCNVSKSNYFLSEWRYKEQLSKPLKRRAPLAVPLALHS